MGVALVDVDLVEEMVVHVVAVGVLILRRQPDVLVQIEGLGQRKVDLALLVQLGEFGVDVLHGRAGGEAEAEFGLGVDRVGDHAGGEFLRVGGSAADGYLQDDRKDKVCE